MTKKNILALLLGVALSACSTASQALPTKSNTSLTWEKYIDETVVGFYLYWKQPADVGYVDARRQMIPRAEVNTGTAFDTLAPIAPLVPRSKGLICFRLTAMDDQNRESDFSNEACGWFGIPAPQGLEAK